MPAEYEALVTALRATWIPFEEYGWKTRPDTIYGVITPEGESDSLDGDGMKTDRAWDTSVDVYFSRIADRKRVIKTVEDALRSVCGASWSLNSTQHEQQTGLFHIEWICEVMGEMTGEPEGD